MAGVELRISEEAGRHFMAPIPSERECSGRSFRVISTQKGSDFGAIFPVCDAVEILKELTCPRASPV